MCDLCFVQTTNQLSVLRTVSGQMSFPMLRFACLLDMNATRHVSDILMDSNT